jgi:hypothetical protein
MSEQTEHEEGLIRAFILPERQSRYLELLLNPKRRKDITKTLAHFKHLDMRFVSAIPSTHHLAPGIMSLLRSKGAGEVCYVVSEDDELDGKHMVLEDAFSAIFGRGIGTFLSCIKGKLGYFEDEDENWILERKGKW